jgi:hypothetical protein
MNASCINFTKCDFYNAKNLALDGTPIVPGCYRITNPKAFLSNALEQTSYGSICRGDVVYERGLFENPYFPPLFNEQSEPVFFVEKSPQLSSRIATLDAKNFLTLSPNQQINDEALNRSVLFTDLFQQLNKNTYSKNRPSPSCEKL